MTRILPPSPVRRALQSLVVAALTAIVFDSHGVLQWIRRLEATTVQSQLLAVWAPAHHQLTRAGLSAFRNGIEHWVSGREDTLLLRGWHGAASLPPPALDEPHAEPPEWPVSSGAVLLLGDSLMAGNLGATLERALRGPVAPTVTRVAQLGTGLARPDVFDWMNVVPGLIERERPRFVVVTLGANDATNLRLEDSFLSYGTSEWQAVYSARVQEMMQVLTSRGAQVLWLGLPPMRDGPLSSRVFMLNEIFAAAARDIPGVDVLPVDAALGSPDGQYTSFVRDGRGRLRRYRLEDGVHLTPAGSRAVADSVLSWLQASL